MLGSVHMSAPPAENDPLHESESSSGYTDGLGTRVLGFDRESGGMLERLVLRPELNVFEAVLTERIGLVAPWRMNGSRSRVPSNGTRTTA